MSQICFIKAAEASWLGASVLTVVGAASDPEQDSKVLVESSTERASRLTQVFKPELDTKVLVDLLVKEQRELQNPTTNTTYLKELKLNENRIHQEPNTPEEIRQIPELMTVS